MNTPLATIGSAGTPMKRVPAVHVAEVTSWMSRSHFSPVLIASCSNV
jgi:hypothetical protein